MTVQLSLLVFNTNSITPLLDICSLIVVNQKIPESDNLYLDAKDKEQQQWTCEAPGERPRSKSTATLTTINAEF
jgi:hypothetical protein